MQSQAGVPTAGEQVPTGTVLNYGAGMLGAQIFRDTPAVLLPIFMTTMLGVEPWLAGLVVLIPKLWVIICDPMVGVFSDRKKAQWGRWPFLLVGAILTGLGFVSLFAFSDYSSPNIAAVTVCFLFFLASTAFSIYSVPYLAIASELSSDANQRTRIMMYRILFATIGVLVGVGVAQPLVAYLGNGKDAWLIMALIVGGISLVTMLVPAIGLRNVPLLSSNEEPTNLLGQLKPVFANKPYRTLLLTCFIQNIGQAASYTVIGFVYLYALDAVWMILPFILVMAACGMISPPMWWKLSSRYGKRACYYASSGIWTLVTISWFFAKPGGEPLMSLPMIGEVNAEHLLILLRAVIIGFTNTAFLMLALSFLTDTIDEERRKNGVAHEGVFSGIFSAAEKLAFALGPLVAGVVMSVSGFQASTGGMVEQSEQAITGVLMLYSLIPAGIQVISLVLFSRFRLENEV